MRAFWTQKALETRYNVEVLTTWPLRVLPTLGPRLIYKISPRLYYRVFKQPAALRNLAPRPPSSLEFELVHVYRIEMLPLARTFASSGARIQFDIDDIEDLKFQGFARLHRESGQHKLATECEREAEFYKELEKEVYKLADRLFASSEKDRKELESRSGTSVSCAPNVYPSVDSPPKLPSEGVFRLLFVGGLDYFPNFHGLLKFLEDVWPQLSSTGDFELTIVGKSRNDSALHKALQQPGIRHLGFVSELHSHYSRCHAAIAPIYGGGGTRIKVLEALSHGRTVIASSKAVEGIELSSGMEFLLADDPISFGQAILSLQNSREQLELLSLNGLRFVEQYHRPSLLEKILCSD